MPTSNDPINIDKPQIEILMDQINAINGTNLDADFFVFSLPMPTSVPGTDVNTKITITPKVSSSYYTPRDIFYKRIDVSELFNNDSVEVIVTTEVLLSELIDQINDKYGIKITEDDYLDTAIAVADPLIPNPTVVFATKPESYIYVGTGGLILGERVRPLDDSDYSRDIAFITDNANSATFINDLVLLNTNYEKAGYFDLLRNTVDIDYFRVDKLIALPNKNFYLGGSFQFEAALNSVPLQAYNSTGLIVDTNGLIVLASDTPLFGAGTNKRYGINKNINSVYLADPENLVTPTNAQKLYKFNLNGTRDNTFSPVGISYIPVIVRVADDGKIYTVSDEFTGPLVSDPLTSGKQIRIDRLNSNGSLDNSFSAIFIRSTGIADVTPVIDLLPVTGGGGFICLKPIHGLSVTGTTPIVNDIPFVTGAEPTDSAFNPIFRFSQSGTLVATFKNVLLNNHPDSVLIDTVNFKENDKVLSFADNKLIFISNRINPMTGHIHRAPMCFNTSGSIVNMAPDRIASDIRWTTITSFNRYDNGKFILTGTGLRKLLNGGWSTPEAMICLYNQSGQLVNIAYKPVIAGVPVPQIYDCAFVESQG